MKNIVKDVLKIGMAGLMSLLILSLVTIVYNYSGIHLSNPSGATDYKWAAGQLKTTMVEGFAWIKMDANGFNNELAIKESTNIDVLLMGSSHMEAAEVSKHENTAYLLNQVLSGTVTYNIGMSGHNIYRCANNLSRAVNEYRPSSYVVLETDTVSLTSEDIQAVLKENMEPIRSYDSGLLYILQRWCPAIKTMYKQITDWRNVDRDRSNIIVDNYASYEEIVSFVKKMRTDCGDSLKLIICYQPEYHINFFGELEFDENRECAEIFATACNENSVVFVDMTDRFIELYKNDYILAHGFSNTAVGIGHLNKQGHRVMADVLAEIIGEK